MIRNSLRYDSTTNVVTFHLRERDWRDLKSRSQIWLAPRDLIQHIEQEWILLGDGNVESIRQVDPVQTFGLFSVQKFVGVEPAQGSSQILKVSFAFLSPTAAWASSAP